MQSSMPLSPWRTLFLSFLRWFDSWAGLHELRESGPPRIDWLRCIPLVAVHLMCVGLFWVGWSWIAVAAAVVLYVVRMFGITGWYHRYFAHRSFRTSRWVQFLFAFITASSAQRGPLWWAGHHRHHHKVSDQEEDIHSPARLGFLWAHIGWFTSRRYFAPNLKFIQDFARFPELRFLDRFDTVAPILLAVGLYYFGAALERFAPGLETNGMQMLIWGFFVSTAALIHGTCTINSMAHRFGSQRYDTRDDSRNNFWLALITLGEGWHNNHHHYPASTRQGFYWWEIDLTYYGLVFLSWLGLVWDLKPVPQHVRNAPRPHREDAA